MAIDLALYGEEACSPRLGVGIVLQFFRTPLIRIGPNEPRILQNRIEIEEFSDAS
jgi:hypothetical protein